MADSNAQEAPWVTIECVGRSHAPSWAVKQRHLINVMSEMAMEFVTRYTRPDGTLIWRDRWPGMDGSDDGYESFVTFPLLYLLGGAGHVDMLARREWNSVTWQFTEYGQVYREFDAYYDWMHHGESSTYIYYLALANPYDHVDRTRALRFADMYTGDDLEASNWDPEHKMIRSPINGSRGPQSEMSAEDWVTHRPVLSHYLTPYLDVPGFDLKDPFAVLDWTDDEIFEKILDLMNERMVPGDVPLNLNATSLVANAYMYTDDDRYRDWVLDYLDAWYARTERNNGITPDNVGPNGEIGERMDGRWWGGYYGWRWPHGAWIILESTLIAGANATLLTGNPGWLDLHRSQVDLLWSLREMRDGQVVVPFRHGSRGWFDYRPMQPRHHLHLYFLSRDPEDWDRIETRFPDRDAWYEGPPNFGKAGHFWPERWFGYVMGENSDFPEQVLADTETCMQRRLDGIDNDDWENLEDWDVHYWQDLNPVVPEGLIQMAMGTPAAVYHGGLLHASVRYFDPIMLRPGLPDGVAALVKRITPYGLTLSLVNIDPNAGREVVVQAGTFAEHQFDSVKISDEDGRIRTYDVKDSDFLLQLGPGAHARMEIEMQRYVYRPTYDFPW